MTNFDREVGLIHYAIILLTTRALVLFPPVISFDLFLLHWHPLVTLFDLPPVGYLTLRYDSGLFLLLSLLLLDLELSLFLHLCLDQEVVRSLLQVVLLDIS